MAVQGKEPSPASRGRRRLLGLWGAWLLHVGDAAREALGRGLLAALVCVSQDAVAHSAPLALDTPFGEQCLALVGVKLLVGAVNPARPHAQGMRRS